MRKPAVLLVGLIIIGFAWAMMTETGQVLTGRWSFTERAEIDRGNYFRLKVDFVYKGEPQNFDIVVGCNVVNIRYKDSGHV